MYPDINIYINLPGGIAGTAQVAEDVHAIGPPPEQSMTQAGGAEVRDGTVPGMPPRPPTSFFMTVCPVHRREA